MRAAGPDGGPRTASPAPQFAEIDARRKLEKEGKRSSNKKLVATKVQQIRSSWKQTFVRFLGETNELRMSRQSEVKNREYMVVNLNQLVSTDLAAAARRGAAFEAGLALRKGSQEMFVYDPCVWDQLIEKPDLPWYAGSRRRVRRRPVARLPSCRRRGVRGGEAPPASS